MIISNVISVHPKSITSISAYGNAVNTFDIETRTRKLTDARRAKQNTCTHETKPYQLNPS